MLYSLLFPLQQWLHERALMLRYMYIACIVKNMTTGKFRDVCQSFAASCFIGSVSTLLTAADEPLFIGTDSPSNTVHVRGAFKF